MKKLKYRSRIFQREDYDEKSHKEKFYRRFVLSVALIKLRLGRKKRTKKKKGMRRRKSSKV